ncbi:hypothetical protein [Chitinimonas sp. JJ19]|uniref:hypothetical protein n=1 Tax=Chitinimonas sp. JJ19 TaxID=3109352 RepID=UPI001A375333|nr:hypothetical protein [Chitinimonas sp.]
MIKPVARPPAEQAIAQITLDSLAFNQDVHAFFQRCGFAPYSLNMWRGPGTPTSSRLSPVTPS